MGFVSHSTWKGYGGGHHVRIISIDGRMFKGPKGADEHERFPRSVYVIFNEGPSPDKSKGKYGETLLQIACDTIEIDSEHVFPPIIKGKIIEVFAAGGGDSDGVGQPRPRLRSHDKLPKKVFLETG